MKIKPEELVSRCEYALSVNYDLDSCSAKWGIGRYAVKHFIQIYCTRSGQEQPRPEYENQRLFDLHVMNREQWCKVWGIPVWEYHRFVKLYEKQCGKKLAIPERRAQWEKEYWERLDR